MRSNPGIRHMPRTLTLLLFATAVLWLTLVAVHARGYLDGGAFTHLEFARSVLQGRGFRFSGQLTYGDDSPAWVWLLCGAHAVFPNWIADAKLLAIVALWFSLAGVY